MLGQPLGGGGVFRVDRVHISPRWACLPLRAGVLFTCSASQHLSHHIPPGQRALRNSEYEKGKESRLLPPPFPFLWWGGGCGLHLLFLPLKLEGRCKLRQGNTFPETFLLQKWLAGSTGYLIVSCWCLLEFDTVCFSGQS